MCSRMLLDSKMCDKAVYTYPFTIKFVSKCFMTQEICDIAIDVFLYVILFLIGIKLKKCWTALFLKIIFLIVYCPDKYKTHRMCDKAVDDFLTAL